MCGFEWNGWDSSLRRRLKKQAEERKPSSFQNPSHSGRMMADTESTFSIYILKVV